MFFFIHGIDKSILLHPDSLGPQIENFINLKLINQVEGSCSREYGWIIAIVSINQKSEGMITDSGDVIFHVKYSALTFKPIDQEVLDGTVSQVQKFGINVQVGPMTIFIGSNNIPSDFEYVENPDPCFQSKSQTISLNKVLRFRMKNFDIKGNVLYGIGTIADDYLGLIEN